MSETSTTPEELKTHTVTEDSDVPNNQSPERGKGVSAETFSYLKEQYTPHRDAASKILLKNHVDPSSPQFRGIRKDVARLSFEKEKAGEVDALTEVLNRKGFNNRLAFEASRSKRTGEPVSVMFFDLNKFKQFNDANGHLAGDDMLKRVAKMLSEVARGSDSVARFGGDEFAVILPGASKVDAVNFWHRVNSTAFHPDPNSDPVIYAVAGIASVDPNEIDGSVHLADVAMYKAKKRSRDTDRNELVTEDELTYEDIIEKDKMEKKKEPDA